MTSSSGPSEAAQLVGRHDEGGAQGDEHVDDAGGEDGAEQGAGVGPARVLDLLGHVGRRLEPEEGEERGDGRREGSRHRGDALGEGRDPARVAVAPTEDDGRHDDDDDEPGHLDERRADVGHQRLAHPAQVDRHERGDEHQGHGDRRELDELLQVVTGERVRQGRRGGDARGEHEEADDEGEVRLVEGALRVARGPTGVRVLGDELGVGAGGQQREHQRDHQRQPDGAPDVLGHRADEGVDAGPEGVADDEEEQEQRGDPALELGVDLPGAAGLGRRRGHAEGFHGGRSPATRGSGRPPGRQGVDRAAVFSHRGECTTPESWWAVRNRRRAPCC